jgi:hypothetical protein
MRRFFLIAALVLLPSAGASASPITWLYTGTVSSSFNTTLVPLGSPVTTLLTADPSNNLAADPGSGAPAWAGSYYFNAAMDFTGRQYNLFGALEFNWDLTFSHPLPGYVRLVPLSFGGPSLVPGSPFNNYQPANPCGTFCGRLVGITDPTSPAFNLPFFSFPLYFVDPGGSNGEVIITGATPQAVPDPPPILLLSSGFLILFGARTLRIRWGV